MRFLTFAYGHLAWWNLQKRQEIVWTPKARFLQIATWLILVGMFTSIILSIGQWGIFSVAILIPLLPLFVGFSLFLAKPLDIVLKQRIINKARNILLSKKLIVIGIAGSYGKTSTKEILAQILEKKFGVIKTPENINTDIGIAQFIITNQSSIQKADIFIVEMGAYEIGDIEKICKIVSPDYSILTGINESHLERFGNIQNTIKAKFELPVHAAKLSVLNFDNDHIRDNYNNFEINDVAGISLESAKRIAVKENFSGIEFEFDGKLFETNLLAEHNVTLILMCCRIAQEIGLDLDEIRESVKSIKPVAHRLEPLYNKTTNVMVIDDSYNGNFDGIKSGVQVLLRAKGKKIVLTPGLVELGNDSQKIHKKIGRMYGENVDEVLLVKSPMTDYIIEGMKEVRFDNFHVYENTNEAHGDLGNVIRGGDTIIFQNDLTDN
jgi:UDP-N-acetylmuramoyl-tripeptide--D-alanyl-D-alanine ligase